MARSAFANHLLIARSTTLGRIGQHSNEAAGQMVWSYRIGRTRPLAVYLENRCPKGLVGSSPTPSAQLDGSRRSLVPATRIIHERAFNDGQARPRSRARPTSGSNGGCRWWRLVQLLRGLSPHVDRDPQQSCPAQ